MKIIFTVAEIVKHINNEITFKLPSAFEVVVKTIGNKKIVQVRDWTSDGFDEDQILIEDEDKIFPSCMLDSLLKKNFSTERKLFIKSFEEK